MAQFTIAMALSISQKLEAVATPPESSSRNVAAFAMRGPRSRLLSCDERNIMTAGDFLFDDCKLDENKVKELDRLMTHQSLDRNLMIPPAVDHTLLNFVGAQPKLDRWEALVQTAKSLALLLLALGTIGDLSACPRWPLGSITCVARCRMYERLKGWNGIKSIQVDHDSWYELLGRMMTGLKFAGPDNTCLISNWGWSLFMSSFADVDPIGVVPGKLTVRLGVPSRNGERRSKIVDGPLSVEGRGLHPVCIETSGQSTKLRCETNAEPRASQVGTQAECFVVSVRYSAVYNTIDGKGCTQIVRTGYREMHRARWNAFIGENCVHELDNPITLPLGTATITGLEYGDSSRADPFPRICIALVHGNRFARWISILRAMPGRNIMLVDAGCIKCAIQGTSPFEGKWVIVC